MHILPETHHGLEKKGRLKNLLGCEEKVNQWLFVCYSLKQMMLMINNDGCLMLFGSILLGMLQSSFHHCYSLRKTELERGFQLWFNGSNDSQRLVG
jgi:hypothetical protein